MKIIFFIVLLLSTFLAKLAQPYGTSANGNLQSRIKKIPYIASFIVTWFFLAFTNIGSDYENYRTIIDTISFENPLYGDSELGFNYLCIIIKTIFNGNPDAVIFFLKTLTLAIIYVSLYKVADKISLPFSILAYISLYWLPSFYLFPIMLSGALCLASFVDWHLTGKKLRPLFFIILACFIHMSAFLIIPFFVVLYRLPSNNNYVRFNFFFFIGALTLLFLSNFLISYMAANLTIFHYDTYNKGESIGTGLRVIVEYALLYVSYSFLNGKNTDRTFKELVFVFVTTNLIVSIAAYSFDVISRVQYLLMPMYLILFSKIMKTMKKSDISVVAISLVLLLNGFLTFQAEIYGEGYLLTYNFFNPFR
ncbi:MAG: EpsG family protein [Prevotellaceae bacterium]|nr:EpsG family protein [Candidatus Faecinaster equi]